MNPKDLNQRAIQISFFVSLLLTALKFIAYFQTKSYAILTDATESIVNVIASGFALYAIYLTRQPKDKNHPYGHGKIEFFSAGFEGALITIAGFFTLIPAIISFFRPHELQDIYNGILLISLTILINGGLGYYLLNLGKRNNSIALVADGKHLLSDSVSSLILIVGLFLVQLTKFRYLDGIFSLLLSIYLMKNGYELVRNSIAGLMDETDEKLFVQLAELLRINRKKNWIDVHNFRIQKYGADLHVDCHLTLPFYLTLQDSHEEVIDFENVIKKNFDSEIEIFTHTDPCIPDCCHYCLVKECQYRTQNFEKEIEWTIEKLGVNAKHFSP